MKKLLLIVATILASTTLYAQVDSVRLEQDKIFQYVNKTLIPTGYLNEYGPEVLYKKWLNGVLADSNRINNIELLNFLYNDIAESRINTAVAAMPPIDSLAKYAEIARWDSITRIALFSANYAILRDSALILNLFTASNNQLFDVAGRTQSPYVQKHAFAAAPVLPASAFNNQIRISYSALYYGNTSKTVSVVQVDFMDGSGYKNIYAGGNSIVQVKNYTDSSGYKVFKIKVIYNDNSFDECYTRQYVKVMQPGPAARYATLSNSELLNPPYKVVPAAYINENPVSLPAAFPTVQQRFNQDMKVYVRYSTKRNGTALQGKIVKPFIIVEGYDIHDCSPLLKPENTDLNSIIDEWESVRQVLPNLYDLNKQLDETAGYDLVFIDYYTMRSITENADYLIQAIDWVNAQKVNNAQGVREQNIVMGISMGGLVSRYALAKRSKQLGGNPTETKTLFTMDSPHQGANVPLGFQHFLYDFGEVRIVKKFKDVSEDLKAFYRLNEKTSTQQQLILRVTDANGNRVTNSFLAAGGTYRTMVDYTAPYEFKALSNGSQCANWLYSPGIALAKSDGSTALAAWVGPGVWINKFKLDMQVNALPAFPSSAQISKVKVERNIRLLFGAIGTGWKTLRNDVRQSPASTIPWDVVPGGTRGLDANINQQGNFPTIDGNILQVFANLLTAIFIVHGNVNISMPFLRDAFSFVPITSALDIQNVTNTTLSQPFNYALYGQNGSTASRYVSQEFYNTDYNTQHTDFTPRNAQWLYNEMENQNNNTINCQGALDCYSSSLALNGSSIICSTAIYTVNVPSGATATWQASIPASVTITPLTPNGSQVSVTPNISSGSINLTVTIILNSSNNVCVPPGPGNIYTATKTVYLGTPGEYSYTPYITQGSNTTYMSKYCNKLTYLCSALRTTVTVPGGATNERIIPLVISPNNYCASGYITDPSASSITWSLVSKSAGTFHGYYNFNGNQFSVGINANYTNEWLVIRCTRSNSCGSYSTDYRFYVTGVCLVPDDYCIAHPTQCRIAAGNGSGTQIETITDLSISPNPNNGQFTVSLTGSLTGIKEILIKDKMGMPVYRAKYRGNENRRPVNLPLRSTDVYMVSVFDGKNWITKSMTVKQ